MVGLTALFMAVFTLLALVTYNPGDYAVPVRVILNKAGRAGAAWSGFLVDVFGLGAFLVPVLFAWTALRSVTSLLRLPPSRLSGAVLLGTVGLTLLSSPWGVFGLSIRAVAGGGYIGQAAFSVLDRYLGGIGAYCLLAFALVAAVQLTFGLTRENFWRPFAAILNEQCWRVADRWRTWRERRAAAGGEPDQDRPAADTPPREKRLPRPRRREAAGTADTPRDEAQSEAVDRFLDALWSSRPPPARSRPPRRPGKSPLSGTASPSRPWSPPPPPCRRSRPRRSSRSSPPPGWPRPSGLILPPLDLLTLPPAPEAEPVEPEICRRQAESLITVPQRFRHPRARCSGWCPAPWSPCSRSSRLQGVKISRIVGLSVDLALAMKALAVRIEGPIPGKDTVGVEIPNAKRQTVYFREILDAEDFRASTSKITLAIGKDIQGRPHVADLARMPHLLVAGATGSGKSVCINGILLSILYKAHARRGEAAAGRSQAHRTFRLQRSAASGAPGRDRNRHGQIRPGLGRGRDGPRATRPWPCLACAISPATTKSSPVWARTGPKNWRPSNRCPIWSSSSTSWPIS